MKNKFHAEWNGECIYNHGKSNARGVAVLINKTLNVEILNFGKDDTGNILITEIKIDDTKFLLANIYAPNLDSPHFFVKLFDMLTKFEARENCIICGDFNLVLNPISDYKNYKSYNYNVHARNMFISLIEKKDVIDTLEKYMGIQENTHGNV